MRKVLILTVTAGNGHNACARAVKNSLESAGETEVKVVDLLKSYSTKLNAWIADRGYNLAVSRLPRIYNAFFDFYLNALPENRYSCAGQGVALSCVRGLMGEILNFKPDVIYCTHFYGAIALTDLKLAYDLPCKTIASVLDYVNSPFWEGGIGIDFLTLPHADFVDEFLFEGFERKQLLPFGRPVDGRTLSFDRARARKKLDIDENGFTVCIMFGGGYWSGGFKIFKDVISALKGKKANVIVVNGKDKKSYKKIEKMKFKDGLSVTNIGFTNEVPLYLSASDVFIGKCGGGTATEVINAGVPMIITEKIPAQEKYNLEFLKRKGVALSFKNKEQLKERLTYLQENADVGNEMANKMQVLKRNASSALAELIISQPKADYSDLKAEKTDLRQVKKTVKRALKSADNLERYLARYYTFNN